MLELKQKYQELKSQLVGEPGFEQSMDEVIWNEGILEAMGNLLKDIHPDIAQLIRLNHI